MLTMPTLVPDGNSGLGRLGAAQPVAVQIRTMKQSILQVMGVYPFRLAQEIFEM